MFKTRPPAVVDRKTHLRVMLAFIVSHKVAMPEPESTEPESGSK